ncbi:MAG: DUF1963 domain-containing protein [Oscillospiraceae bacterium]|nr:DUF1963 domain-containing protein [Oscillospiraceae bacterium]
MVKKRVERRPGPALREAMRAEEVLEVLRGRFHRPACALRLSQGPVTVFDSHIGGLPYCPREGEPPVGEDGRQLRLMVQINFAQMPGMPPFPERGMLQFFLPDHDPLVGHRGMEHWTEQKDWRVLYHPEIDPTVTEEEVRVKVTVGPAVAEEGRERRYNSAILVDNLVYKLHFEPVREEGITRSDFRFWPQFLKAWGDTCDEPPPEQFWPKRRTEDPVSLDQMEADRLWQELDDDASGRTSKIGGYPAFPKGDPRAVLPMCADGECPYDTVLLHIEPDFRDVEDLSQGYYPLCFGEDGRAVFLMREEDLLRRDFSRVGYYWQDNSDAAYFKELCGEEWRPSARLAFSPV